ncbi:sugar phosphate nucleotidyltransferase [Halobellus sp. GM3]|uniref:sugar phosphate nucleotidyltransferase n=1 Tax=Halobellus sp. GM3 TaxID=3458410 RepID=UPI00403D8897
MPTESLPVVAVVLAGGTGSRLYPASRSDRPKQFLSLAGGARAEADADADDDTDANSDDDTDADSGASLLERTVSRARAVADEVVVITRESYAEGVRSRVPDAAVLVEPAGRDTGPALLYATHRIGRRYDDCVVLALPSDHLVGEGFAEAVGRGTDVAAAVDRLVTFGVEPTRPETGYGYIEPADPDGDVGPDGDTDWLPVASFHEKPDAETAEAYVETGYYWNAGLFAFRPAVFLDAASSSPLSPLLDALRSAESGGPTGESGRTEGNGSIPEGESAAAAAFRSTDAVSVDYAIFETSEEVAVVPVSFPWDDIGSWDALERAADFDAAAGVDADDAENVAVGDVTVRTLDAADNVVAGDGAHVSLVGVSDLAVVSWDDRVLVVPKDRAQDVKSLVRSLEDRGEF